MKLVFISNYLSAHQMELCDSFYELLGDDFSFISTGKIGEARIELGMPDIVRCYNKKIENIDSLSLNMVEMIDDADVVIYGSAPEHLVKNRLRKGKLTFKYAERIYKKEPFGKAKLKSYIGTYIHYVRYLRYPFYVLCSSGYTAGDINRNFKFKDRSYKWGYFPPQKKYENIEEIIDNKESKLILWVGRLLDWKHPEIPILLAKKLKLDGHKFKMNIIGIGEMENVLKKLIEDNQLNDCVSLLGAVKNDQTRKHMEKADIFLFTSDFYEGWGAVLNEAMNSGCACVASHAIGSVPFLIEDGVNGVIFKNEDIGDLYEKVVKLINDDELRRKLGKNAYYTINNEWNAKNAANKFLELCENLLAGKKNPFKTGLCSESEILNNDWY